MGVEVEKRRVVIEVEIEKPEEITKTIQQKTRKLFGTLKNWRIDTQKLKDELREAHSE